MKNDPIFKFVAAAIFAAVCTAFYSATHFKTQVLYREAVARTAITHSKPQHGSDVGGALRPDTNAAWHPVGA